MSVSPALNELPFDVIGFIFARAGAEAVLTMACLSRWWYNLGSSELVWREQCFILFNERKQQAETYHEEILGAQSFTEQKGILSWRAFWFALKRNAHFVECSNCRKYPLLTCRYECILCENYVLCADCESAIATQEPPPHPKSHILAKMWFPVVRKFYFNYKGDPVHKTTCTKCHKKEITGRRYNKGPDVTYCEACFQTISTPTQEWICQKYPDLHTFPAENLGKNHRGAWCDVCGQPSIPINWKCSCCYDYDLCTPCMDGKKHKKKHAILKIFFAAFSWTEWQYIKKSDRFKDSEMSDHSDYDEL